jgi:hypothetical protein
MQTEHRSRESRDLTGAPPDGEISEGKIDEKNGRRPSSRDMMNPREGNLNWGTPEGKNRMLMRCDLLPAAGKMNREHEPLKPE